MTTNGPYTKTPSGIIVPKKPPTPPVSRRLGPMEVQSEEGREQVCKALDLLWDAMGLKYRSIEPGADARYDAHMCVYEMLGNMLLGGNGPSREILT